MNQLRRARSQPGDRNDKYVRFLLATICLLAGLQIAMPVNAAETGIKGTILWGPVESGPAVIGQSDEAPLSAAFIVLDAKRKVASFKSDEEGRFLVLLPAGEYAIVPDKSKPALFPGEQKKMVTVPENGFAMVTLRYDTGMR